MRWCGMHGTHFVEMRRKSCKRCAEEDKNACANNEGILQSTHYMYNNT